MEKIEKNKLATILCTRVMSALLTGYGFLIGWPGYAGDYSSSTVATSPTASVSGPSLSPAQQAHLFRSPIVKVMNI
jgi:hypothetical protein